MPFNVISIGTRMPAWVNDGCLEYSKRMPAEFRIKTTEIPLANRGKNQSASRAMEDEGLAILKAIGPRDFVIALDVIGKSMSTLKLAAQMASWQMQGDQITFVIGGPDGLSKNCLDRADMRWSLSDLTLPHPLVRVLLMEQLYRAWSINANHPYHRN